MSSIAAATMLITAFGTQVPALTSMPVSTMQECRKNMVSYVDELPDAKVMRKTENTITAEVSPAGVTFRIVVKCQTRDNPQS